MCVTQCASRSVRHAVCVTQNQARATLERMEEDGQLPDTIAVPFVRCRPQEDAQVVLCRLGLGHPRPALFLSGGARKIAPEHRALATECLRGVAQAATRLGMALVSGGTNCGVMASLGEACASLPQPPPLIGVLPSGIVARRGAAILERHHSHFLFVEGGDWGVESGWLSRLAAALTKGQHPCLGLLINGGRIARRDLSAALEQGLTVWAMEGSGRLADGLAQHRQGSAAPDPQLQALAAAANLSFLPATLRARAMEQRILKHFRRS